MTPWVLGNVYVAGGFDCSGCVLAPKVGQLIGALVVNGGNKGALCFGDQQFLLDFSAERLPGGHQEYREWICEARRRILCY